MKLLFVTEFFPDPKKTFTGGVETRTFFTTQLLKRRHPLKVLSRRSSQVPTTFLSIPSRLLFILKAITQGVGYRADLVEGSNVTCYLPTWIIAQINHIPAVAWVPDILGDEWNHFGLTGILGRFLERFSLKLPWAHYIALSQQTKAKLLTLGINPEKITVVYPGINLPEFTIKVTKRRFPTLCVIARLVPYKRIGDSLKVLAQLQASFLQLRLLIIGQGPELNRLHHQVKALNLNHQVYFKAHLPRQDLIKQLKSCHLVCHFSTVEGFGLVLLEALAAGLPYVAYDTPINREVTHQGQGGILTSVGDITGAATAIKKLLENKTFYRQKVTQGQKLLTHYSWSASAHQTEQVYLSITQKRVKSTTP